VEPHLIATFYSCEFSPYKRRYEKIVQTAEIHVGPDEEDFWPRVRIWRKGGREPVVWLGDVDWEADSREVVV
jgi:hypothetical protein